MWGDKVKICIEGLDCEFIWLEADIISMNHHKPGVLIDPVLYIGRVKRISWCDVDPENEKIAWDNFQKSIQSSQRGK